MEGVMAVMVKRLKIVRESVGEGERMTRLAGVVTEWKCGEDKGVLIMRKLRGLWIFSANKEARVTMGDNR